MAQYLVRARPQHLADLRAELDSGAVQGLRPFGGELHACLTRARVDAAGWATWEEQCYCVPPLAQERAVLDRYFTELTVETIQPGQGWARIDHLPGLWE